ncbi:MAG: YdcF family protein [Alphaproteobacteria bacterium]|nr:YdcF family protein [Alphaproteobacteria bacterium]
MFFYLSKILWAILSPLTLIALIICGGYVLRSRKIGRGVMGVGIALLILSGFCPIGYNMLVYLENQTSQRSMLSSRLPAHVNGIIVLGGAVEVETSVARGQVQLNEHAPRLTEMIRLARQYPTAKIVLSGGNGRLRDVGSSEALQSKRFLQTIGFDTTRLTLEDKSRNTYENCIFSKAMVGPKPQEVWILVTSAFHMPRAQAVFESQDWPIMAYPAGYLTAGAYKLSPNLDVLENMYTLQIALKEMIGIMAYTLTGKIHAHDSHDPRDPISDSSGVRDPVVPGQSSGAGR